MAIFWLKNLNFVQGWRQKQVSKPKTLLRQPTRLVSGKVKQFKQKMQWLLKSLPIPPGLVDLGGPVILTSCVVTGALVGIRVLGGIEKFELTAYDHLLSLRPVAPLDQRFLIVGITEEDVQARREWPLSDRTVAQALSKLQEYQPRVIGLDIMRDVPLQPGRQELLDVFKSQQNIIVVCKASSGNYLGVPPPPEIAPEAVGFSDLVIDPGGVLRRAVLWMDPPPPTGDLMNQAGHLCSGPPSGPQTMLSLGLQTAFVYLAGENVQPELTPSGELKLGNARFKRLPSHFGGYQSIDNAGYQVMLNYRSGNQLARQVSLTQLLNGEVDPSWIRDRIVLMGYLTPQAGDDFYTPYSQAQRDEQKMAGVLIHAHATSQILSAVLDNRSLIWAWPMAIEGLWILGWALAGGMLAWYIRQAWRLSLAVLGVAAGMYLLCLVAMFQGGWLPLVPGIIALGATASSTITVLNQRLKNENLRIKTELDITRRLQQMILPPQTELSAIQELDIAGYMDPCDEVGGDYYDVLSHNGHLKIGIGDVTGHGLESGLIMIMVQTAVRTLLESDEADAQKFLNLLNKAIYRNVQRTQCNRTMTLSLLDYKNGKLSMSGQHEDVLIVRANGELEKIDTVDLGFPIALEEDIEDFINQTHIYLDPGDLVVLYTDGITEAMNPQRDLYGLDRLCEVLVEHHQLPAEDIKNAVIDHVRQFIGVQTVFDDITLLVIKQN
jgi:CHASE2 domain-containing sensor protein